MVASVIVAPYRAAVGNTADGWLAAGERGLQLAGGFVDGAVEDGGLGLAAPTRGEAVAAATVVRVCADAVAAGAAQQCADRTR
jgi:hypothetical protein